MALYSEYGNLVAGDCNVFSPVMATKDPERAELCWFGHVLRECSACADS